MNLAYVALAVVLVGIGLVSLLMLIGVSAVGRELRREEQAEAGERRRVEKRAAQSMLRGPLVYDPLTDSYINMTGRTFVTGKTLHFHGLRTPRGQRFTDGASSRPESISVTSEPIPSNLARQDAPGATISSQPDLRYPLK